MPPVTPTLVSSLPNDLQLKILSLLQTQTPSTSAPPTQLHAPPAALPTHVNPHRILHNVAAEGYCILDGFVEGGGAGEVLGACQALEKDGSLRPAGMGTGITRNVDSSIRGDKTKYFLNGDLVSTDKGFGDSMDSRRTAPEPIISLKQKLDALVGHFNQSLFQDTSNTPSSHLLTPKGLQIAYYPPNGARYVKHRDASPLNPNRRITILLYLNEGWESEHGGHLRMYAPAPVVGGDTYTDIPPIMNRLVIFRSDLEHEVLPSFANRFAITMWLYSTRDVASLLSALATTSLPAADSEPTLSPPPPPPPTIFVSVPSYRDPETHHTVSSLLKTATHPSRIHVGILYQDHPTEDVALHDQHALPSHSHIRTLHIPSHDAKGPAYARALIAQKLYAGETYYFQVDSHMRFAEGWDTYLVDLVTTAGGKSVVTMYPPGYTLPSTGGGEANDDDTAAKGGDKAILASAPYGPVIMYPHRFDTDDMLRVSGRLTFPFPPAQTANSPPHDLVPQKFVAAGCLFAPASPLLQDLYPPTTNPTDWAGLFFGEEAAVSAMLWTRGWEFWTPRDGVRGVAWHLWERGYRKTFWENLGLEGKRKAAQERVKVLLGMCEGVGGGGDAGVMKVGSVRTLREFEEFCGVCFAKREILKE